jgi:hypothetical protein
MSSSFIAGYTKNDESRGDPGKLFPFVDILAADGTAYTSFGTEPFTPNNELRYKTYQVKDDITRFSSRHSLTVGGTLQRYESENLFFSIQQSGYVYNSLQDFYTDANGFLANPNRTVSPVTLRRFQVRYANIPNVAKPYQRLKVWNGGGYVQDEWRMQSNVTVTGGVRLDMAAFGNTAFPNPTVDALTFRDETGAAVHYASGNLPDAKALWSPRVAMNWDVAGKQNTQVRVGTGVFSGPPPYVWVSNQLGQTGVLFGFDQFDNTTIRPFNPNPDTSQQATGASAASFESTSPIRTSSSRRCGAPTSCRPPAGRHHEHHRVLFNKDVNGIYYLNANLPATNRVRRRRCARALDGNRINNTSPIITAAYG